MERRLQSAMEYLMTYGWAILAIAIVMVSLYSLGIFNTGSLQPTATPGSCEVVRTAAQTSLAGQCSNLIPKYVGKFDGSSGYVSSPTSNQQLTQGTVVLWWSEASPAGREFLWTRGADGAAKDYDLIIDSSHTYFFRVFTDSDTQYNIDWRDTGFEYDTWYQIAATWNSTGTFSLYRDGALVESSSGKSYPSSFYSNLQGIGGNSSLDQVFGGSIANVQVYNISLDNSSIKTLYLEGIGGAPVDTQHLAGWWPLNGNANDYSGNNNQGTAVGGVIWEANWQNGYSAPTS